MNSVLELVPYKFSGYRGLTFHRQLLKDSVRTKAFREAIQTAVQPGDIVADLGTGTGVLAFFAADAGAKRIYALEVDDIIQTAKLVAHTNKYRNITFIQRDSRLVTFQEKLDLIISDCMGYFLYGGNMVSALIDLRERYLKPGGRIIPELISLFLAPIHSPPHYDQHTFWQQTRYGLNLKNFQSLANNNVYYTIFSEDALIATPAKIDQFNLRQDFSNEMISIHQQFTPIRKRPMHGFTAWFDVRLIQDITFSTGPSAPPTVWKQLYFPISKPIELTTQDTINLQLQLLRTDDDRVVCFTWKVQVITAGGAVKSTQGFSTTNSYPTPYPYQELVDQIESEKNVQDRYQTVAELIKKRDVEKTLDEICRLEKLVKQHPENSQIRFELASLYQKIDQPDRAREELKRAIEE